jgi:ubiquinone/menaquinone biosynthesis C-methylase UbiE
MEKHVCPWWLGYTFLMPIRKYQHNPYKILGPHIKPGMIVMDYGCAMGFFSIPLAKMTGAEGKVYCVDIQHKMLASLQKRALKFGVSPIIKPLLVGRDYRASYLQEKLDFVLLFMVVHEIPDKAGLFKDIYSMLKPRGKVLFFEPKGHVSPDDFKISLDIAQNTGLKMLDEKPLKNNLCVFLEKLNIQ